MFLTANSLVIQYGIDETIAKFFVDREPPKENLYWKDKQLYLRAEMGYIFLPMIVDLFYKSGIAREILLDESFIEVLEKIGHFSAEEEAGLVTSNVALSNTVAFISGKAKNEDLFKKLIGYFKGEVNWISALATPFSALHRGDLFLFSLCTLQLNEEQQARMVKIWFSLISTILVLDDAEDYPKDILKNEENAFLQSGNNKKGYMELSALVEANIDYLSALNKTLSGAIAKMYAALPDKTFIKEYLNR